MTMSYKTAIPKEVQEYIDIVEQEKIRTCKEQKQLVELVKKTFKNETLIINQNQIDKYLSYQKYLFAS